MSFYLKFSKCTAGKLVIVECCLHLKTNVVLLWKAVFFIKETTCQPQSGKCVSDVFNFICLWEEQSIRGMYVVYIISPLEDQHSTYGEEKEAFWCAYLSLRKLRTRRRTSAVASCASVLWNAMCLALHFTIITRGPGCGIDGPSQESRSRLSAPATADSCK